MLTLQSNATINAKIGLFGDRAKQTDTGKNLRLRLPPNRHGQNCVQKNIRHFRL